MPPWLRALLERYGVPGVLVAVLGGLFLERTPSADALKDFTGTVAEVRQQVEKATDSMAALAKDVTRVAVVVETIAQNNHPTRREFDELRDRTREVERKLYELLAAAKKE